MKKFLITINAYGHYSKFEVESADDPNSLEQSILDKLGENSIVWEKTGMFGPLNRITYEEVVNDTRPIQSKKLEEAAIAHRQNTVEGAAPQVSVAT